MKSLLNILTKYKMIYWFNAKEQKKMLAELEKELREYFAS